VILPDLSLKVGRIIPSAQMSNTPFAPDQAVTDYSAGLGKTEGFVVDEDPRPPSPTDW
jgi:hypothetical protein